MGDIPQTPLHRARNWWARHEDRVLQAVIASAGLCIVLVALSGCATVPEFEWRKERPASAKPWAYVIVENVDLTCRSQMGASALNILRIAGCATWKPAGCMIYLPHGAAEWIVRHEERHCEGWGHK